MRKVVTNLYLFSVLLLGAIVAVATMAQLSIAEPVKLVCFCALALVSATMKVKLPGITGSLSITYVVTLHGVADLSLPECLLAALGAALVQIYFRSEEH